MAHRYVLACFVFIFCWVDGESLYALKGLSVSLKPAIPSKPADILWKHNGNKLIEFDGMEEYVYGTFKNRITLDWHTADIKITDLRFEDSGNYELEATINNKLYRSLVTLVVIDKVPKPTISCKMNDGSSSNKSGTLECSAESKDNQTQLNSLLKFDWESHGNVQPGPQLTISLGDEHDDHVYICNVSNPKSSETTTFTAKDCYPDEGSSVALAAGLAIFFALFGLGIVVLGILVCHRKHKACFAGRRDDESLPGSTEKVSDNQVEESRPLLSMPAAKQPPGTTGSDMTTTLGNGNSQNVDEAYQQVPVKDLKKMFEGEKGADEKMNKGKAPPVPPLSALSSESAKKEEPADEPADLEEDKMSHQESSAAPEEPGLETTLSQSENNKDEHEKTGTSPTSPLPMKDLKKVFEEEKDGEMNKGKAPPVPLSSELSLEPAEEEVPQSDPSVSEKANEPDHADESADSEEDKMSESCTAPEESGSDQTTAQAEENHTPTDDAATDQQPDKKKGADEKMNKGEAPPVRPRRALSPEPAKKEDPADKPADLEEDKMSHQESSAAPEEPGSDQTTAQAEENHTPTDEAATDQQPDKKKGGKMNKGKAPPVPPRRDKKEAEKDGEANVPSDSVSPSAKALSPLT